MVLFTVTHGLRSCHSDGNGDQSVPLQAGEQHPLVAVHAKPPSDGTNAVYRTKAERAADAPTELHLSPLGSLVCGGASGIASSLATECRTYHRACG